MIGSFRHKGPGEFFETGSKRGISPDLSSRIARRLDVAGFNLHRLKGDRQSEWAISVSGNWRITFRFAKGEALDINLEGYH